MRLKLCDKYKLERQDLIKKILNILNYEENKSFTLYELDNNKEKQEAILSLKDDIKKIFLVGPITPFKPSVASTKRDYLNIVRGVLKQEGYTLIGKDQNIIDSDGTVKRTTKYFILKP